MKAISAHIQDYLLFQADQVSASASNYDITTEMFYFPIISPLIWLVHHTDIPCTLTQQLTQKRKIDHWKYVENPHL